MTQVFVMNSFAKTPEGGNPAGVVLNSHFKEEEMLKIASKAGFSETWSDKQKGCCYEPQIVIEGGQI